MAPKTEVDEKRKVSSVSSEVSEEADQQQDKPAGERKVTSKNRLTSSRTNLQVRGR